VDPSIGREVAPEVAERPFYFGFLINPSRPAIHRIMPAPSLAREEVDRTLGIIVFL